MEIDGVLETLYLKPGEMVVRTGPARITTVLGSCIAVTLFAPRLRAGAICHALLPVCKELDRCREPCRTPHKYVNCVVPEMVRALQRRGAATREIEVKLFGGADMFGPVKRNDYLTVGRQNIHAAVQAVEARGLKIRLRDVGNSHGRKIHFFPHTGEVWMKRLGAGQRPALQSDRALLDPQPSRSG